MTVVILAVKVLQTKTINHIAACAYAGLLWVGLGFHRMNWK